MMIRKSLQYESFCERISPADARDRLGDSLESLLSDAKTIEYAERMAADGWHELSEMILDQSGAVLNGRHRLAAVVLSGIPQDFRIIKLTVKPVQPRHAFASREVADSRFAICKACNVLNDDGQQVWCDKDDTHSKLGNCIRSRAGRFSARLVKIQSTCKKWDAPAESIG